VRLALGGEVSSRWHNVVDMVITRLLMIGLFLGAVFLFAGPSAASPLTDEIRTALIGIVQDSVDSQIRLSGRLEVNGGALFPVYRQNDFTPFWHHELGLTPLARQWIDQLRSSSDEGLCSDDYRLPLLEALHDFEADSLRYGVLFDPHYQAILDLLLTDSFFRYAGDLLGDEQPQVDLLRRLLARVLREGSFETVPAALEPSHAEYRILREQLHRLQRLAALGGWEIVPAAETLRFGDAGVAVDLLKRRLVLDEDLAPLDAVEDEGFGGKTDAAVRSFQRRHGLRADGVVGLRTFAELNVPVEQRLRTIEQNMQRWRSMPASLGARHIRVNIAGFQLEVHEGDEVVMTMPVVVGTGYRKTPQFSATMRYLIFAPYWNVPPTILREDKLPKIKADPGWLVRHHYEIVPWKKREQGAALDPYRIDWSRIDARNFPGLLRQRPGRWNPLGRVKFMLPNRHAVYLHDTDSPHLFASEQRLFSSGCIRLERPEDLAQYLLVENGDWTCDRLFDALERSSEYRVDLPEPLPVHIVYWTAWVDSAGKMQWRPDIYQRDTDLEVSWRQRFEQLRYRQTAEEEVKTDP